MNSSCVRALAGRSGELCNPTACLWGGAIQQVWINHGMPSCCSCRYGLASGNMACTTACCCDVYKVTQGPMPCQTLQSMQVGCKYADWSPGLSMHVAGCAVARCMAEWSLEQRTCCSLPHNASHTSSCLNRARPAPTSCCCSCTVKPALLTSSLPCADRSAQRSVLHVSARQSCKATDDDHTQLMMRSRAGLRQAWTTMNVPYSHACPFVAVV